MSDAATRNLPVYYITHEDNLPSILERGILSHAKAAADLPKKSTIYDGTIVQKRLRRQTPEGKSLWLYANLYFQARNPMMYRVYSCERRKVVALRLGGDIYDAAKYVSVGNAAALASEIVELAAGLKEIRGKDMQRILNGEGWNKEDGSKRLIMAELLVPDCVPPEYIDTIYVPDDEARDRVKEHCPGKNVSSEPQMFFCPQWAADVEGTRIRLVDGDMFFSQLQTLSISVNTVGAMGKGLAARAKYNYPHLYVKFQDLCRSKTLTTKRPFLYSEPYSHDEHMAYDAKDMEPSPNDEKWFLLFATKEHWRNPSRLEYIEDGLAWLVENAHERGMQSLAMPALGCGLGGLPWAEVGPLMCRYLRKLDIPCEIYLPREGGIPQEQLTAGFLLR